MVSMTQHYLAGELSMLLGQLQAVAPSQALVRDVGRLRRDAETGPLTALGSVVVRALELTTPFAGSRWDAETPEGSRKRDLTQVWVAKADGTKVIVGTASALVGGQ